MGRLSRVARTVRARKESVIVQNEIVTKMEKPS